MTQQYRLKLAEAHCKSCPFYWDAMCWLKPPSKPNQKDESLTDLSIQKLIPSQPETTYCPLFLINMSDEFRILDDQTSGGSITREQLLKKACALSLAMEATEDQDRLQYQTTIGHVDNDCIRNMKWLVELSPRQKEVLWKITTANVSIRSNHDEATKDLDDRYDMEHLVDCFLRKDPKALLEPNEDRAATRHKLSKESCILSLFGWRLMETTSSLEKEYISKERITIQCPFCHAIRQVQYVDQGEDSTPFDLVNSHRYYCPYAYGFPCEDGTKCMKDPCWMKVASSISKCWKQNSPHKT